MSGQDVERTVGRLRIRVDAPPEGAETYRGHAEGELVIEHSGAPTEAASRPAPVVVVIGAINTALMGFAVYVRSWPAVGTVSVAMIALAWLVLSSRRSTVRRATVRVGDRLLAPALEVAVCDVHAVGVGFGDASSKTVWVGLPEGRALVLSELTHEEADAAADALREAIERRRERA